MRADLSTKNQHVKPPMGKPRTSPQAVYKNQDQGKQEQDYWILRVVITVVQSAQMGMIEQWARVTAQR